MRHFIKVMHKNILILYLIHSKINDYCDYVRKNNLIDIVDEIIPEKKQIIQICNKLSA